jgi:predicted TIM-barrel fold metal-dependent hydrolase
MRQYQRIVLIFLIFPLLVGAWVLFIAEAEGRTSLKYDRKTLEKKWRDRIQSFLDRGVIPLVDLESSLKRKDGRKYLDGSVSVMDELGVALIAFDGRQAPRRSKKQEGYRWGYYIHEIVNNYPDRFILATNGGTNKNWFSQKNSFVDQLEEHVRSGVYPIMGEIEFRHYMSSQQCKEGRTDRDISIPLNGLSGQRIFSLSQETGIPFVIHLEPEDGPLKALEEMLESYPKAKVIFAHFGQIRHPEKERRFSPELVRHLLATYPNLYYDISVGHPGRRYKCNGVLDTVIWQEGGFGSQKSALKPEYKAILTEFSNRFVVGFDYGGGRAPLLEFLKNRVKNVRLIMRELPEETKHNIGYRNAWKLLTGLDWTASGKNK